MSGKVTCWKTAHKDGDRLTVREGAWEVCWPAGGGKLNTVIFSGPDAGWAAKAYALMLREDLITETIDDYEPNIEDLLS